MNYTIYDPTTGEIKTTGFCHEYDLQFMTPTKPLVLLENVQAHPREAYVKDGIVTLYTADQKRTKTLRPWISCNDWSNESMSWVPLDIPKEAA